MRWIRGLPAVVILILAGIGYWLLIPITHVERARLSQLALARPTVGFKAKPTNAMQVDASSSPFATVKKGGKRSPSSTGAYAVEWAGSGSSSDIATILVSLLPSEADGIAVDREAQQSYLAAQSLQSASYSLEGSFAIHTFPGAKAATFVSTSSTDRKRLAVVVFRVSRVVVVEIVQKAGPSASAVAASTSLGHAEYRHLVQLRSGFSLVQTSYPFVASLVYWIVAVSLAVAVFCAPVTIGWISRRRRLRREMAARTQFRARGRKVIKRQAARRR